jgi:hypothetical protein
MATRGLRNWPYTHTCPEDLLPAELTLLDAIRAWEEARRRGDPQMHRARLVLEAEGAAAAVQALDGLLRAMTSSRPTRIGCVLCPRLTQDEPLLLTAVALAQRQARGEALAMFLQRLPAPDAYAATAAAIAVGCHFRAAGLRFTDPWTIPSTAGGVGLTSA